MSDPRIDFLKALLAQHRADVAEAFAESPAEIRATSPEDGSWSVARVLEHLTLTERSLTKLVASYVSQAQPRDRASKYSEDAFARELDIPWVLDRTRRVKGSQPPGEMTAEEAWSALAESRAALLAQLDGAAGLNLSGFSRPHPATQQELNAYQWIAFLGLHEGRHAQQIREIVARLTGV
jgi:hypothetical protein